MPRLQTDLALLEPDLVAQQVVWTLDEALGLIRALQPLTRQFGYHLCLGGGVLNKGESSKDLDLYFLQLDANDTASLADKLIKWLDNLWGEGVDLRNPDYPIPDETTYLYKRKYDYCGMRVDVFVL